MNPRVGIITIHHVPNYGAMLQAYALSTYLRESGVAAEVIDYRPPLMSKVFDIPFRVPPPVNAWLRKRRCSSFVEDQIPLTPKRFFTPEQFEPHAREYDLLIAGSDQIWFTGPNQGYDRMFFLDLPGFAGVTATYAASAGSTTDLQGDTTRAKASLNRIEHLSIRDASTSDLVAPLLGRRPTQVLDPVFLHDFSRFEAILARRPQASPYVLVFGNLHDPAATAMIRNAARSLAAEVVTLQYENPAADRRIPAPDPVQWMRYFRHATLVITSYFHGTAFAIKFNRPFVSIPTPGRVAKVTGLLDRVGLAGCLVSAAGEPDAWRAGANMDWSNVNRRLGEQIDASKSFLAGVVRAAGHPVGATAS